MTIIFQTAMKIVSELTTPIRYCSWLVFVGMFFSMSNHVEVKATAQQVLKGFSATPDSSVSSFQPLVTDPTNQFSLGFLRIGRSELSLVILHIPSSQPMWAARTSGSVKWSKPTQLLFNGSLILSCSDSIVWLAESKGGGVLVLLNNSNLQIQSLDDDSVVWQSFDFPSDSLVENQNFTSKMSLISSNGVFSMRLGEDYIGLYAQFDQMYWKHSAMEAKAEIVDGSGPIYAQISSNGFLGMYQTEKAPADVLPFDTFQRPISGIRRLTLEENGNLKAYYWNGSTWITDMVAISDECELPSYCGSYGLCRPGKGCECLDDTRHYGKTNSCIESSSSSILTTHSDFCGAQPQQYWVFRRKGVELPNKQLMDFQTMTSLEECEASCDNNCTCWGATFNNASGYCYTINHPILSLVGVGDDTKMGYFKVRRVAEKKFKVGYLIGIGLFVVCLVLLFGVAGIGVYKFWKRKKRRNALMEYGMSPGPYTGLGSSSFRSIELCKT